MCLLLILLSSRGQGYVTGHLDVLIQFQTMSVLQNDVKSLKTGNGNWLQFKTDRTFKLVNYLIWPEGWGEWPYGCVVVCADNFTVRNLKSRVPDNKVSGWE